MSETQLRSYVIDTCALLDLDGYNQDTAFTNDVQVKERIWGGVLRLIQAERLVTVRAVRDEIERKAPSIVERLQPVWSIFTQSDSIELFAETQRVIAQFPNLVPNIDKLAANRDPGDPYVIAYARLTGARVVTNELPKELRTRNSRKEIHIPDACRVRGLQWDSLRDFVAFEDL